MRLKLNEINRVLIYETKKLNKTNDTHATLNTKHSQ